MTKTFQQYSSHWEEFPVTKEAWGVEKIQGQLLTEHGKLVISRMGTYFGEYYAPLLSGAACQESFFYADNCTRDIQTATNFLDGLSPKCAAAGAAKDITVADATILFNQGNYQTPGCSLPPKEELDAMLGGSEHQYQAYRSAHANFVNQVQNVVDCCSDKTLCGGATPCTLADIPTQYQGKMYAAVNGSVYLSGYFASFFTLAALNNMTIGLPSVPKTLSDITNWYHESSSTLDVVDGPPTSPSFVSTMASHLVASLQQASTGQNVAAVAHGPRTKFVYMAGHDTNLVLLRTLLDLTWLANGWQQNDPAPGSMLVFELYDDGSGGHNVEIFFQVATPQQIRNAEILSTSNPPSRTPVLLPGCSLQCPLSNFTKIVLSAVNIDCVGMPPLKQYVLAQENNTSSQIAPPWAFIVGAVGLVLITAAIIIPLTIFFSGKTAGGSSEKNSASYLLSGEH